MELVSDNVQSISPHLRDAHVPAPLRDLPLWICWRFEQYPNEVKARKVPIYPSGERRHGTQGSPEDLAKLTTFAVARDAAMKRGFAGVGFAHTREGGVVTMDFDACVRDGVVDPVVLNLVVGTYAEYSPSGKGIHAIFLGDPDVLANQKSYATDEQFGVEAFSSSGFTTFTGCMLEHVDLVGDEDTIAPLPQRLVDFCQTRFGKRAPGSIPDDPFAGHEPKLGLTVEQMEQILKHVSADIGRDEWIRVGMALHHECEGDDTGFDIWDEWSSDGATYPGTEGLRTQWASFDRRAGQRQRQVTMASVIHMAKQNGYVHTKSEAQIVPLVGCNKFRLLDRAAIMAQPPLRWCVKGLLPETGIGAIYGPSQSGKSFLCFDLGIAIAKGNAWFGHRTTSHPVTYVMLESEAGLRNRVEAWEVHNGASIPEGFRAMPQPFQLAERDQVEELGALLPSGGVVIIDTLNRAAPGLDENSSQDMGRILAGMKRLQEITGGLVIAVHHTGKDASKGLRGHSSLFAALDGAIEVERNANGRCWSAAKVKDGEDGKQVPFKLHPIGLGTDADGDPITSCAVGPDHDMVFKPNPPTGPHQKEALPMIRAMLRASPILGKAGAGPQAACITFDDAVAEAATGLVGVEKKRRVSRAREAVQGLVKGGHLRRGLDAEQVEWVWL